MTGEVRLELVEKPATTLPDAQSCQAIAHARGTRQSLGEALLHELRQCPVDRRGVVDEAKDVGRGDIRTEPFPVEPEHDLQDLVAPSQAVDGIGAATAIGEQALDVP